MGAFSDIVKSSVTFVSISMIYTHGVAVLLVLLLVVVIAWYSTYVVEPVVQSVILVERSPVAGTGAADTQEINSSTVEEVGPGFDHDQRLSTNLVTIPGEASGDAVPAAAAARHGQRERGRDCRAAAAGPGGLCDKHSHFTLILTVLLLR